MRTTLFTLAASFVLASTLTAGDRPVIAVAEFKNDSGAHWWSSGVGRDLAGMLSNELASVGKFRVVERSKLDRVLDEQDLAASGRIDRRTGAEIGRVTGAQYLVIGTISSYDEESRGSGGGLSFRGVSVRGRRDDAYIAVDLRVVDTTTGEVEFSRTVEARAGGFGVGVGVWRHGFGGNLAKYDKTPAGKAIRAVLMEISDYLGCAMVDQNGCLRGYDAKESSRREKTKRSVVLD